LGQISAHRIIIVGSLLLLTVLLIRQKADSTKSSVNSEPLRESLQCVGDWQAGPPILVDKAIKESLDLDDYVFSTYSNGREGVTLYIGYYYTQKKVGAAHSPLVCFPGQGWLISDRQEGTIRVGKNAVQKESIVLRRGEQKILAVYWFQALNRTSSGTFRQKINLFLNTLQNITSDRRREDNAFVRIMVPIIGDDVETAGETANRFIEDFYPVFLHHINSR
jgi:EpsI family protein